MMSIWDMFYGPSEPVWIMKLDKEGNRMAENKSDSTSNKKEAEKDMDYSFLSNIPYHPYYYPEYVPSAPHHKKGVSNKGGANQQQEKKETRVVMKVPICCEECEEMVEAALYRMKGLESVECDTRRERVTAAPADILMECRKVFKKFRIIEL